MVFHKDLLIYAYKENITMNNYTLIHTTSSLEHVMMKKL